MDLFVSLGSAVYMCVLSENLLCSLGGERWSELDRCLKNVCTIKIIHQNNGRRHRDISGSHTYMSWSGREEVMVGGIWKQVCPY